MNTPTPHSPAAAGSHRPRRSVARRPRSLATTLAAAALLGLAVTPADVRASSASDPNIEKALELEARAQAHKDEPDRHHHMARLLERAADYREDSDPHKVENLRAASRLYFYTDRYRQSENAAARGAELALRQGDVVEASHAYLDAALVAAERGANDSAMEWIAEARMLADSPLLDTEARAAIMRRVNDTA
ncbi:MAG: hypothetical protein EA352_01260 [Gemmatimonadales bacterium]|nr:MAG: hypothetical protein EA352_01260 [Gemmatimonadales bacterium]